MEKLKLENIAIDRSDEFIRQWRKEKKDRRKSVIKPIRSVEFWHYDKTTGEMVLDKIVNNFAK